MPLRTPESGGKSLYGDIIISSLKRRSLKNYLKLLIRTVNTYLLLTDTRRSSSSSGYGSGSSYGSRGGSSGSSYGSNSASPSSYSSRGGSSGQSGRELCNKIFNIKCVTANTQSCNKDSRGEKYNKCVCKSGFTGGDCSYRAYG